MYVMGDLVHKRILTIYWTVVLLSAVFLYLDMPYSLVTEPLLVPLLALYMFMKDGNIARPRGKLVFFCGLFLAFLGDVLQLVIDNDIFFLSSLVAFMLMNGCYSVSFLSLQPGFYRRPWLFVATGGILFFVADRFISFLGDEQLGDLKIPLIFYITTLCIMVSLAVSLAGRKVYRRITLTLLLPGALIFLVQNMFLALNLFHLGSESKLYVFSILPYGVAQYLMVRGMYRVYSGKHEA